MQRYVVLSLELHLFFTRIMKEHSFFLEAGFVQKDESFIKEADNYRRQFEKVLCDVVKLSDGIIRCDVLDSGEVVTKFTCSAEKHTEKLTGIPINTEITLLEQELRCNRDIRITPDIARKVRRINRELIRLLDGLIHLKEEILRKMLSCDMYTFNYPLLIKHILREAKLYRSYIIALENGKDIEDQNARQVELFWNQIMMEHALFIRGLLDPSECELIDTSNNFAKEFACLLDAAKEMTDETIESITNETIRKTKELRDFKAAGTKGIDNCEIQSIIVPLLADHVLREANHYLRLLYAEKKSCNK